MLLLAGVAAPAWAVDFNALWEYQRRGGDNIDTVGRLQQRYSLGLGQGMSFQPTPAISASANFSYARTDRDVGAGMTTTEEFTPSAQLAVTNDIFRAVLSGMATEFRPDIGEKYTSNSWNTSLASNWQYSLWPALSLNYGERKEETLGLAGMVGSETEDKHYNLTVDWDLLVARFYYDYSVGQLEDLTNDSRNDRDSHLVRVETGRSFWNNRIRFSLSQQYQQSDSDFFMLTPDGLFEAPVEIEEIRSFVTPAAVAPLPEDPGFDDLFAGGLPVVPVGNGERLYLVAGSSFPQQVNTVHIFIDPFAVDVLQIANLPWNVHVRRGGIWMLEAENIPASYNFVQERLELNVDLPEPAREFMLSTDVSGLAAGLDIRRLEAIARINVDSSNDQKSYQTSASLFFRLTRTLAASSSLILDRAENETERLMESGTGDAAESELVRSRFVSNRRTVTGSLRWTPSPLVIPSVNFSETRLETTGAADEISRSYGLILATLPLPAMSLTLGATRTDRFQDAQKITTTDNYSLTSTAPIYPDLTASLNSNYITSDRMQSDGSVLTTDSFLSRFTLNARLNPKLIADLSTNYRSTQRDDAATVSTADSTLSLTYRPSDLLMMRVTGTKYLSGIDAPDPLSFIMDLALLRTRNTRLNFLYNHNRGTETSNSYVLNGSWDISQMLSMQARFNYRSAEFDSWNTTLLLSLRL